MMKGKIHSVLLFLLLTACGSGDFTQESEMKRRNQKGEFISRKSGETLTIPEMRPLDPPLYFWETGEKSALPKITKEYFRCKGNPLNPVRIEEVRGEKVRYFDCGGSDKHSLFLRDQKEWIYPILPAILNYLQEKTGKRVVITSGYRCPEHNAYVDPHPSNQTSKHMIGAEVDFYVQGMEQKPEEVVKLIMEYYKDQKEYQEFKRYEKPDAQVSTQPWMNKELFIKICKATEGRNFDNRHPYPYIALQVRYDRDKKERVAYSWDSSVHGYLRF